jgi:hypothetical protein
MTHAFKPSMIDPTKCAICSRALLDHSKAAHCESCDYIGNCEVNGEGMLLCPECFDKNTVKLVDRVTASANDFVAKSQAVDAAITDSKQWFNAPTVSICELRDSIMADEAIPADKRAFELQRVIKERINHFQDTLFKIHDNKVEDRVLMSFGENLRNLGESIRQEIRERIKADDDKYVVIKPKKINIPKVGEKKTPYEMIIEKVALSLGISKTEAEIRVRDKGLM